MSRRAETRRTTGETDVRAAVDLDGSGIATVSTGVGFFDHMRTLFARHSLIDVEVDARGDLETGSHHTVEDVGITLGQAVHKAVGDKKGIRRYGHAYVPLDEALSRCVIDLSGRPWLHFGVEFKARQIGTMPTELFEDFFWAVADHGRLNIHLDTIRGRNGHHIAETLFKSTARALSMAVALDPRVKDVPSTKGSL